MPGTNEVRSPRSDVSGHVLPQQKRTRYTPIACDECKRRKVKCDGKVPCRRCDRNPADCVYTQRGGDANPRPEACDWRGMNEKLSKLQEQIDLLVSSAASNISLPRSDASVILASTSPADRLNDPAAAEAHKGSRDVPHTDERRKSGLTQQPQYVGPTSTAFGLGVATNSLQEMGIQLRSDIAGRATTSNLTTPARTPPPPAHDPFSAQDPLSYISFNEASRLVSLYEEESGTVYPFIDIRVVLTTAQQFYNSVSSQRTHSVVRRTGDKNTFSGGLLDILKLVVTIASVLEGHGPTVLSRSLLESVEYGFEGRLCGPTVDLLEIQAWTLMSILQFHCDQEALAWRTIGLAARAAVELGLHRRDTYLSKFSDPEQRPWANKLFWCIYVLDRRWSFGTGLPFALHDDDIDPGLPEQDDPNSPLLKTMIAYGQLGSKVWKATAHLTSGADDDTLAFLDFQVSQWQESIAPDLQLHTHNDDMLEGYSRTKNRLRILLYLRANQMRLLIFRRVLLSPKTISENIAEAWKAVNVARDTICLLDRLNRISDIYSSQQTSFNYFLVSALAVVFLAVCHATTQFNQSCRGEFYLALDLVRGFSAKSHVARRLWKTVKHLKMIGPKLGVFPAPVQYRDNQGRAHQEIASLPISMTGLTAPPSDADMEYAYHNSADIPFPPAPASDCSFPLDGIQLSDELTNLFETIDPSYVQSLVDNPGNQEVFDLYTYEPTEGFSRSLLGLL